MRHNDCGTSRTPSPTNDTGTKPLCFEPERRTGEANMEPADYQPGGGMERARLDEEGEAA